jgi:hypothetical protein
VFKVTEACPLKPVLAAELDSVPLFVVNVTGTLASGFPLVSDTVAVMTEDPPAAGSLEGEAPTAILPAAAPPTFSFKLGFAVSAGLAPPDAARISASPDWPLPTNWVVATPLTVRASVGLIDPSVVVNETAVPFWTGVPDDSRTIARISAVPFAWTTLLLLDRVMVDSRGASNGTLSHADKTNPTLATTAHTMKHLERAGFVMMENMRTRISV